MNLNRGYLYGSTTSNSSFDIAADVQIDSLMISDGYWLTTYNFSGDISGSGTFERTSDAKGANQTYVFTGDMSAYSGEMKLSKANDGDAFKFIGNQSGTGAITIAAGNTIEVDGATMNNSSITSAGLFKVSGNSSFIGAVRSTGELNVSGTATFDGALTSSGILKVNSNATLGGTIYSEGSLVLGPDALLTNQGSFSFGENATINLVHAVAAEDEQRTLTYTIFSSGSTGTSNFSELSLENIIGIQSVGRDWSFNDDGTLVGVLNNHALSYAGGNLTWNTTTATFSNGSETVAFSNGDDVTFSGTSAVTLGESLSVQRLTVANGAEVTISGEGSGALSLAEAVVNGTLKLCKGGEDGAFSGNVDVYGTLSVETGDVTGWSGSDGIKSIDIFAGGEMQVNVSRNQTGAGLAINLLGGRITGVSGANFDLGYGGVIYGYSSISALAADDATAETPTVSTISGTNLTLRQNHTTISVAENARLDISSGIFNGSGKDLLNGEGAVPPHLQAGLVKTGAGELRLSGNNTYTQATTVAEGTLTLADSASLVSASVSLISGTTFKLDTSAVSGITCSGAVNGSGSIVKTGAGNATIGTIGSSFTGEIDVQMGTLSVQSFDFEQTKSVFIHSGATLDLNLAQGASYHLQTPIGGAGMLQKSGSGSLDISDLPDSFTGGISLQGGTLKVGDSLLVSNNFDFAVGTNDAVLLGSLTLGDGTLWLNASGSGAATSLKGSDLTLLGGTHLQLSGGNGGVYDLFSGITALRDKDGNIISLDSTNNAAANYFDINCPGSSFWADSTLQLTSEGTLQLVRHNEPVKNTLSVTSRLSSAADYRYYSSITFKDLDYSIQGGAVYVASSSTVTLSNNGSLSFSGNTAHHGGALMAYGNITVRENGSVSFIGNSATEGGAVWGYGNIVLSDNGSLSFRGNTATNGGALMVYGNITVRENGSVSFSGNSASYGGTVYVASSGVITLNNNGCVSFSSNSAFFGGALEVSGNITLSGNGHVSFDANSASYSGGAIYGGDHSNITLCDNGIINFCGNSVSESGGAIKAFSSSTIMLSNNDSVSFVDNSASSCGGAISAESSSSLTLSNNKSVSFIGNSASDFFGGAIIGYGNIALRENDSVIFIGNSASWGGAISASGSLSICNNDFVLFEKNVEKFGSAYRLRGIYADGDVISLSAAAGKSIEFRDSVYIGSSATVNLNEHYTDADGSAIKQLGDIIFTGKYAETHLNEILAADEQGRIATAEEIRLSRTTEVNAMTNLYGGRLRVEDGAIYQGWGITAMEGSAATVRVQNATLSHSGYDLTFNAGTTLELAGANSISGNLNLLDGSTLHIDFAGNEFTTNLDGSPLALTGDAFLRLTGAGNGDGKTYTLLTGVSGLLDAQGNAITLDDTNNAISNYFDASQPGTGFWADGTLQLTDAGTLQLVLHNETVKEAITITSRQTNPSAYQYYAGIAFEDISNYSDSYAYGGAIYGEWGSTITLSNNGSVTFSGNTASSSSSDSRAYGGAINGDVGSTITLSDTGSVTFSGYTASSSDGYVYGGAIYGYEDSTITLSDNGSVTFSGNTAESASSNAYGGAIYGHSSSTITLSDNGSVTFSGNTASASSSNAYGGAIFGVSSSTITLSSNGSVTFSGNTAESASSNAYGGAIFGSTITLSDNGSVVFEGNTASASSSSVFGGAIYGGDRGSTITLSDNGSVTFSGNTASGSSFSAYGGAIDGDVTMEGNGSVTFIGNTASSTSSSARGGAIYGYGSTITLSDNGSVTFSGNTASASSYVSYVSADGGAINGDVGSTITLSDNGSVSFSGNTASGRYAYGGAIYTQGDLSIRNNDSVEFYKNAEVSGNTYRLRSIYAYDGNGGEISLSAAAGKSITFYDSVYIGSDATVNLNQDYAYQAENGSYVTIRQQGDIIFTGADTEQHLNDLLEADGAGRVATAEEILNSRTTEVCAMTNLYGGRLRVEEGAIYQGQGITAMEGSAATVRVQNATLSHSGYDLTFNAGTKLEVAGHGSIIGKVNMMADSLFKLEQAASLSLHETLGADAAELTVQGTALLAGSSTLNASLTLADGASLDMMSLDAGAVTINGALTFGGKVEMGEHLMAILDEMHGWNESVTLFTGIESLVLPVTVNSEASSRVWVGDVFSNLVGYEQYYFNYVPDVGSLMVVHVPEPTTTTLGLLTLAGLALRRRRK